MNSALLIILVTLWRLIVFMPLKFQNLISKFFGHLINFIPIKRNRISKINIDLCFKDLNQKERLSIYKKNIKAFARVIFDTGIAWFWSDNKIKKNIPYKIKGLKNLLSNQNSGIGILLFFKHSLHLELDSRILAMHAEIYGIEREHNSKKFENIQKMGRLKSMKGITDRENTFTFMRWLKKGKTVLYAPDQDYGIKKSIEVNFFGVPAATVKAPLKIIEKTGCKTFFIDSYYEQDTLILDLEEINIDQSSIENFCEKLNLFIENKIRIHPHEYLWQHRRFKSTLGKNKLYK
ncbi:MAG: hypothetical protein VXZ97_01010 [Pseudomonadota bacterium]|nr:hypothetical protein [Pseudomonadota bacterium]